MADNKVYYYMRLKEHFFDSDELIILESMESGYKYSNILLKLYLRSLKRNGKLMLNDTIPYNVEILAKVTRHDSEAVEKALKIFKELGLVEIVPSGAIYIPNIAELVGKSSTEADRKRIQRMRIDKERINVRQMSDKCQDISTPEIELDKELDIDKEKSNSKASNIEVNSQHSTVYKEIIEYLNLKAGTHYRSSTKATQRHIKSRLNEGYELDDFKKVIDVKTDDWLGNNEMAKYLRPETLFGNKFESYLNQDKTINKVPYKSHTLDDYDIPEASEDIFSKGDD